MITSPYDKYRQSSVKTAAPEHLVVMLYDGAIRFIRTAMQGLESSDVTKSNLHFGKAQTIISELMSTLDQSYDVSKNLYVLYEYTNFLLIEANIKKDKAKAEEALGYLVELRETWVEASKIAGSQAQKTASIGSGEAIHG
ncbi:flagellar export chaperone FliS [Paenibacillus lemnae]|uniref:Flagellar secretion chaperone FliS n=1 Tax=Paenibacillus lemnae TaxID=1330551 RepID=A0A848M9P8_PAELE|nr:flagellar export chaperone FliS [Paenibacillus lemnae]NMO96623.1 flagellar export chaperone FliS [Paenibacillus lemnae]